MSVDGNKLRALQDQLYVILMSRFPVTCNSCKKHFKEPESFLEATHAMKRSAVLEVALQRSEWAVMEHLKHCVCGAELFVRRDDTQIGDRKRVLFDMLLPQITSKGIRVDVAKEELRKVLQGKESEILRAKGFNIKTNFTLPGTGEKE